MNPTARIGALAVLLAATGAAALMVDLPELAEIRTWTAAAGPAAPFAFVLAYAVLVLAPVPKSVLSAAAGLVFGVPLGIAVVLTGTTLGALGAFGTARVLGRGTVERYARGQLERVDSTLERYGVMAALFVRVIPIMPFTLLNYACGVTAMKWRHYALGTAVGIVPGTSALVCLGSAGTHLPTGWLIAGSVGLGGATLMIALIRHPRPSRPRIVDQDPGRN